MEIDAVNAGMLTGAGEQILTIAADNTEVHGLIMNNAGFGQSSSGVNDPSAMSVYASNVKIQGNYFGSDYSGLISKTNVGCGVCGSGSAANVLFGGLNPEDRNLFVSNRQLAISPNTGASNWTIQGNYFGIGADGITPMGNSTVGGSGTMSLDNSSGHIVGGSQAGAINVIGENFGHGIAPDNADNLLLEGNYIGYAYDGVTVLGNNMVGSGSGIALSNSDNVLIKNNRIAGWETGGISINNGNTGVTIDGNLATKNSQAGVKLQSPGVDFHNNTVVDNLDLGILVLSSSNTITNNQISNNHGTANIQIAGIPALASDNVLRGNKIGTNPDGSINTGFTQGTGIIIAGNVSNSVIGGVNTQDSNIIVGNTGAGISITELNIIGLGVLSPSSNSVLGNVIYSNVSGNIFGFAAPGIGIDHMVTTLNGFTPQSIAQEGPTLNDVSDSDTGANGYINFPDIDSATQTGISLAINLDLDAADSPSNQYRVEFFANDTADPTGYGEGQTFLGYALLNPGSGQLVNLTLPTGLDLTGKFISSTTTAIDASTPSGFGSTSEFSPLTIPIIKAVETTTSTTTSVVPPPNVGVGSGSSNLPTTGVFSSRNVTLALILISFGSLIITVRKRRPLLWQSRN